MKKTIPLDKVRVGMYVDSLGKDWMNHSFLRNSFLIKDAEVLRKLRSSKLKAVVIDTSKGLDVESDAAVADARPAEQVEHSNRPGGQQKPLFPETTAADIRQARKAFAMASQVVNELMNDVRSGKALKAEKAQDSAEQIIKSIDSNPHTLTAVTRIKTRDEYTFQHSVGVATLLASFARGIGGYSRAQIEDITIGGIIHDIGKVNVPDSVLNKPDKLNDEEFLIMKKHVEYSREILEENSGFSQMQLDISLMHHERPDGKGYPLGLTADEISEIGAMGAIVDVYDALSTRRVYKEAWEPSHALKSMVQWGPGQFNQPLLMQFIRHLGVYPVGTWVMLESGKIGFVLSLNEDKLRPVVQVKLDLRSRRLMNVEINLAKNTREAIKAVASPSQYGLDEDFVL